MKNNLRTTIILFSALLALGSCKKKDASPDEDGLVLNEDFGSGTSSFITTNSHTKIEDGHLVISYATSSVGIVDAISSRNAFAETDTQQSAEVSFQHTEGHSYDQASLYFGITGQNFFSFSIGSREFRIHSRINGEARNVVGWTASSAIKGAMNEVNKLKITLAGEKLKFFINGTVVANVNAPGWKTLDRLGLSIGKLGSADRTTYKVDYIKCWNK
ncbi:hypothetical protein [Pedobacter sp. SYP-B3415]|uniref:hypothetical protein n=1 Tax=Pedobacter sp. SYP-B3415 TaxID=2496641 RepID=UPI00101D4B8E|nr:hypothetical protein [Pedobacter sp. SYP-B3415]